MSTLPLKDCKGAALGEVTLSDKFVVAEKGAQAVYQAVRNYQTAQHQGSANTQGKGAVAGSGKKPWKQKGLGRARAGYRQSPVWRGGAVAFGPRPNRIRRDLPKKVARLAFTRAFAQRADESAVTVIEDFKLETPKTKEFVSLLKTLGVSGKTLFVVTESDVNIGLAGRNLQDVEVTCASTMNTYQVVRYPQIVITKAALAALEERVA